MAKVADAGEGFNSHLRYCLVSKPNLHLSGKVSAIIGFVMFHPPSTFGHCLGFAPRSQNLTFGAELLFVRFARYPDYLTNVRVVRPQIRFPRKGGRCAGARLM